MMNYKEILKKVLTIILIIIIIYLIITLFSPKYKEIKYKENVELTNRIEFQIVSNSIENQVLPTNYESVYSYYSLFDNAKNILDIKCIVKNSSSKSIKLDDIFKKADIIFDKKTYPAAILFEEENGKQFIEDTKRTIEVKQELVCHFSLGIMDKHIVNGDNPILRIKTKNDKFEYKMQVKLLDQNIKNETSIINRNYRGKIIEKNELNVVQDICEFTVEYVGYKDKIEPTYKSGAYEYYIANQGKKYLDVQVLVKNTSNTGKTLEDMLGYATLIDNENNKICNLSKIVEENNNSKFISQTEIFKISINEQKKYHLIAEIPLEMINSGNELYVKLYINGENYIYKIM